MLKLLIKKQLAEIFRQYFYDFKKNKPRRKGNVILLFVLFAVLMLVVSGAVMGVIAYGLSEIAVAGYGWFYWAIMGLIGVVLGVIGSVFNTYSGLYLAKDNDLLLSMPIPPRTIVTARTASVYIMALLYSATVTVPATVVYFIKMSLTAKSVMGAIFMIIIVSLIDLILSCLLGWVVAKLSVKMKSKVFFKVFLSIAFIVLYYLIYFKALDSVKELLKNIAVYGDAVKSRAYPVYLFGAIGTGDLRAILIFFGITLAVTATAYLVLSKTFIKIATSGGEVPAVKSRAGNAHSVKDGAKRSGVFRSLVSKEFSRLKSSSTYLLNCALGTLLLPALGVFVIIKGGELLPLLGVYLAGFPGWETVVVCFIICAAAMMNTVSAPSVPLEGKTIWVLRSLPVEPEKVLFAKLSAHMILTAPAVLVCSVCCLITFRPSVADSVFIVMIPLSFALMMGSLGLVLGVRNPNLNWTQEIVPIKQSMSMVVAVFAAMGINAAFAGLFFLFGSRAPYVYLSCALALYLAVSAFCISYLSKRGAERFAQL